MKRKAVCLIVTVLLLICTTVLGSAAVKDTARLPITYSGKHGTNLSWKLDPAGTLTISGQGAMTSGQPGWLGKAAIKTIVIQSGVTSVSYRAFYNCMSVTKVTLPSTLTSIGDYAFQGC